MVGRVPEIALALNMQRASARCDRAGVEALWGRRPEQAGGPYRAQAGRDPSTGAIDISLHPTETPVQKLINQPHNAVVHTQAWAWLLAEVASAHADDSPRLPSFAVVTLLAESA